MDERVVRSFRPDGSHVARHWTVARMIEAIWTIKSNSEPINIGYLVKNHNRLAQAINDFPGGWKRIVTEAGFDTEIERGKIGRKRVKSEQASG